MLTVVIRLHQAGLNTVVVSPPEEGNCSTLRTLYYPPVKHEEVKEGQLRCGEHSDYGSITLLFKSSVGLQVTPAPPVCMQEK